MEIRVKPIIKVLSLKVSFDKLLKLILMEIKHFIGIDISKSTLDWAVCTPQGGIVYQTQSANSEEAVKGIINIIKTLPGFENLKSVFCMEHTGIYNAHLLSHLHRFHFPIWLENSLQIKRSGGIQRGKNDAIDAVRIAQYAFRFKDKIRIWQPPRQVIQQLAALSAVRHRLLLVRQQLQQPLNEQESFIELSLQKQLCKTCQASLKAINADLEKVDNQIKEIRENDPHLKELFEFVTSVPGIGVVTASEVIIATNEFNNIAQPKKLACHAGVAPFEHQSGSSVRGKTGVNHHARKRLKSLFHLAAMSAVRVKGEIQEYYLRKVAEGKNKMLVLNAVRNKLIHRVCAVVHKREKYDKNYMLTLA